MLCYFVIPFRKSGLSVYTVEEVKRDRGTIYSRKLIIGNREVVIDLA